MKNSDLKQNKAKKTLWFNFKVTETTNTKAAKTEKNTHELTTTNNAD